MKRKVSISVAALALAGASIALPQQAQAQTHGSVVGGVGYLISCDREADTCTTCIQVSPSGNPVCWTVPYSEEMAQAPE